MERLRIGLTISGAVALGAYEGGALAALLVALRSIQEQAPGEVAIDAIAGASAGSMTGVLTARGLLTRDDPLELMYQAWVQDPSLKSMRAHGPGAPLSVARMRASAEKLLDGSCRPGSGLPQPTPIALQLAVGALRGLDYTFSRFGSPPLDATTYLDWYRLDFSSASTTADYLAGIAPALASGAHSMAFAAEGLSRERDRADYLANGVTNFPETGYLWYTDGGTVDNQPLGRALGMTNALDDAFTGERLHLLVIPDPPFAITTADPHWADPARAPVWVKTLEHAAGMAISQTLYDDLVQADKTNSRLRWTDDLVRTLAGQLPASAATPLVELITRIESERSRDLGATSDAPPPPPEPADGLAALTERALGAATGLHSKRPISVDAVSPRILDADSKAAVHDLLAGEFLGHFGGFLELGLRRSDFALGYESMLAWLGDPGRGLGARGVEPAQVQAAVASARARADEHWRNEGKLTLGKLGLGAWWQLARVGIRAVRLAISGLRS
jgi:hypothetical protein